VEPGLKTYQDFLAEQLAASLELNKQLLSHLREYGDRIRDLEGQVAAYAEADRIRLNTITDWRHPIYGPGIVPQPVPEGASNETIPQCSTPGCKGRRMFCADLCANCSQTR
jgi:hypothetical protein